LSREEGVVSVGVPTDKYHLTLLKLIKDFILTAPFACGIVTRVLMLIALDHNMKALRA
jgi:hypothetical protein